MMRIAAFLLRRIGAGLFTLLALIAVTFIVYWALPSTPAPYVYPGAPHLTAYQVDHANELLGLKRPKIVQYADYLSHLARGDIGRSWNGSTLVQNTRLESPPLGPILFPALRLTMSIILGGAALVLLLALPLGAFSGTRIGTLPDRVISTGSLVGICTHPMVLGLILSTVFGGQHLNWVPGGGYCPLFRGADDPCGGLHDWSLHLALPWITFALLFLALYTRMIRASVADTLHEDFIRTARAKGARESRVITRHMLPPASLRVLTMVGMEIGTALGVCIYIEAAYGMQGLARLSVFAMGGATQAIDLPFTLGIVVLITLIVVVGNLVVDLLYAVLDPRTGRESARGRQKSLVGGVF